MSLSLSLKREAKSQCFSSYFATRVLNERVGEITGVPNTSIMRQLKDISVTLSHSKLHSSPNKIEAVQIALNHNQLAKKPQAHKDLNKSPTAWKTVKQFFKYYYSFTKHIGFGGF